MTSLSDATRACAQLYNHPHEPLSIRNRNRYEHHRWRAVLMRHFARVLYSSAFCAMGSEGRKRGDGLGKVLQVSFTTEVPRSVLRRSGWLVI